MPGRIRPASKTAEKRHKKQMLYAFLVELHIIPMNSTGIYRNGFTPDSTGQIRPGINYWSNWVEIH